MLRKGKGQDHLYLFTDILYKKGDKNNTSIKEVKIMKLVVVESPGKLPAIRSYLGRDYKVLALKRTYS